MATVLTRFDIWDLNNGLVAEFPVASPPGWDAVSLHYARALQRMGHVAGVADLEVESTWPYSEDPTSYHFQAAMHGTPRWGGGAPPAPADRWWVHCTHASDADGNPVGEPYFLPWHRAYIYWFEVIVRGHVAALGGPDGWALPYWNYSLHDDGGAPWPRSALPWAFCQANLPDGTPNPLFIGDRRKRGLQPTAAGGGPMYLQELTPHYDTAFARSDYDGFNATLDGQPHGPVHVNVGTGDRPVGTRAWMRSTVTASFDPIFWIHHAEIDRFWVAWNATNANPTGDDWRNASADPELATRWNFWRDADIDAPVRTLPGDMVDPEHLGAAFPYSYRYANLPELPAPRPGGVLPGVALAGIAPEDPVNPFEGESEDTVVLGHDAVTATVPLAPAPPAQGLAAAPSRVTLHLEGVAADAPAANYAVYLNYRDADRDTGASVPHYVGLLTSFGAEHKHGGEGHHAPHSRTAGLRYEYDVTDLVAHLDGSGEWDPANASVTFVPTTPPPEDDPEPPNLRVGRIAFRST